MSDIKNLKGLTPEQVEESRKKYGNNIVTPSKRVSMWKLFFEKFNDPIIKILIVAAVVSLGISFVEGGFEEPIGIFIAIFLATGISFYFERDANKKFEALTQVNDDLPVRAIRNGKLIEVPKRDIVVGDVVLIETGDEIPADGTLVEAVSLQVDESTLTGELMIDKTTDPEDFDKEATYPSNAVMRGTTVLDGRGTFIVEKVGDATQYGQVAKNATKETEEETPLNKQLSSLAGLISGIAVVLGLATFFIMVYKELSALPQESLLPAQKVTLSAVITFAITAMMKVLLPAISNTLSVFKVNTTKIIELSDKSWSVFLAIGIVVSAITYLIGGAIIGFFSPFVAEAWVTPNVVKYIIDAFMVAVTLIVVVVPEGLPMSITLSLALNMRRMLKTNNLVRKIHASETMGAVTVICTDKTGTLTQNKMHVEFLKLFSTKSEGIDDSVNSKIFAEAIAANTTAQLGLDTEGKESVLGNPTEGALLNFLKENSIDYAPIREKAKLVKQLTFTTQRKYMATLVVSDVTGKRTLYVKGAPEILMANSKTVLTTEGEVAMSEIKPQIDEKLVSFQSKAMRTLAFGIREVADNDDRALEDIISEEGVKFIAFVAISDPVRADVPAAVKRCLEAGVGIKIVTGDTFATAKEIGRQIGIWTENDTEENIIGGVDFEALSDEEAFKRAQKLKIMCRARPTDKQRLVSLLQKAGEVVAVTGDGTNDAPALNQAHVGLSMGTGTAVAKEASDITLLDDSFASIAMAVMWGRSLYRNIQRFLLFQLTINIVALIVVFTGVFFTTEPPLTVMQMLWVNIIMDTFAAMAFASIRPENNVMQVPPRKNSGFIINKGMFRQMLITSGIFVATLITMLTCPIKGFEVNTRAFSSLFFTVFVMLQFVNMFVVRGYSYKRVKGEKFKDLYPATFLLVALLIYVGQIIIVQFGGEAFRVEPLSFDSWAIISGSAIILIVADLFTKLFGKR
ncbi:MAG: cation-translocating P-type ATPase [Bacteroidales bacterium]|nr:cation-translocating P-type ATPase [Bacteroidales bacterium]